MAKVLIPTKLDKFAADLLINNNYCVVQDAANPIEEVVKANPDAEALIVRSEKVTKEIIDMLPQLKLVVRAGAGFNTIDIKYARERNVDVMNTPGANSNGVAEEVVALALAAFRYIVPADASTRAGDWEKSKFMGRELTEKTVGIIGLGHIGQLVVKRMSGFDCKFLGFDPFLPAEVAAKLGVELVSMEEIFAKADVITLHIPENDATRNSINKTYFDLMKEGACLINCARAGIINEDDLRAAKAAKKFFYCNDVYAKDAAGPKSIADVADVMMPHLGANTFEANFNAAKKAAEQTIAYFENGVKDAVVNK
jgi:D-3-phosphoglycerate dehydrogenase